MNRNRMLYCPPSRWRRMASIEANSRGLCPVRLLAGDKHRVFVTARWHVWRELYVGGCSFASIARASGFDHTTIMHGLRRLRGESADAGRKSLVSDMELT